MLARTVPLGLTFDDVLLLPGESDVVPSEVNTATRLTRNVDAVASRWCPARWTR